MLAELLHIRSLSKWTVHLFLILTFIKVEGNSFFSPERGGDVIFRNFRLFCNLKSLCCSAMMAARAVWQSGFPKWHFLPSQNYVCGSSAEEAKGPHWFLWAFRSPVFFYRYPIFTIKIPLSNNGLPSTKMRKNIPHYYKKNGPPPHL